MSKTTDAALCLHC